MSFYNDGEDYGGWEGKLTVWVLRGPKGTEYVVGERAVPADDRLKDVIAKIGPIAYEAGQGMERFQKRYGEQIKQAESLEADKAQMQRVQRILQRELDARFPPPPPVATDPEAES